MLDIELFRDKPKSYSKCLGLEEIQAYRAPSCTNMEWNNETVNLRIKRISNSNFLLKLVKLMFKQLPDVILKNGVTTRYKNKTNANFCCTLLMFL